MKCLIFSADYSNFAPFMFFVAIFLSVRNSTWDAKLLAFSFYDTIDPWSFFVFYDTGTFEKFRPIIS